MEPFLAHFPTGVIPEELRRFITQSSAVFAAHNGLRFDFPILARHNCLPQRWVDTMTLELLIVEGRANRLRPPSASLAATLKRRLGVNTKEDADHNWWSLPELPEAAVSYAKADVAMLLPMYHAQLAELQRLGMEQAWELEKAIAPVILRMERNGIPYDAERWRAFVETQGRIAEENIAAMTAMSGVEISPNSAAAVKEQAFRIGGATLPDTTKSTLMETRLDNIGSPVEQYLEHVQVARSAVKRTSMYGGDFLLLHSEGGRVKGSLNPMGAHTSRFSSSSPNLQQMPRDMRSVFVAPEGKSLVAVDYDGLEARMIAQVAQDYDLRHTMQKGDLHMDCAELLLHRNRDVIDKEGRNRGKAVSFTFGFGGGYRAVQRAALATGDKLSAMQAQGALNGILGKYPATSRWQAEHQQRARRAFLTGDGGVMRLSHGYKIQYAAADMRKTTLCNNQVQGLSAVGMKLAILEAEKRGLGQCLLATVHDELLAEVPTEHAERYGDLLRAAMIDGMTQVLDFVKVEADIQVGSSWGS